MASATPVFEKMTTSPRDISQVDRDVIEQFVVALYCKAFDGIKVNEARRYLFTSRGKAIENISPTAAALNERCGQSAHHCKEVQMQKEWAEVYRIMRLP